MLTISTNKPITRTNIVNNNLSYPKNLPIKQNNISFKGTVIRPVKNFPEIKELVNLFYDALKQNIEPNKKTFKLLEKLDRYLCTLPFLTVAKQSSSVTEIVKSENKLAGGYSMNINPINATAHIGFITLSKEYMRTPKGIEILKLIGKSICQNAELNDVKDLIWTTNSKNKQINRLLKRFNPEKVRKIAGETEYKISLNEFKEKIQSM